jgi:hypothetical protein
MGEGLKTEKPVGLRYSLCFRRRSEAMARQAPSFARKRGSERTGPLGSPLRIGQPSADIRDTFSVVIMSRYARNFLSPMESQLLKSNERQLALNLKL